MATKQKKETRTYVNVNLILRVPTSVSPEQINKCVTDALTPAKKLLAGFQMETTGFTTYIRSDAEIGPQKEDDY